MIIPTPILKVITGEEAEILVRFYGTAFYKPYLDKLKQKYYQVFEFFGEDD